MGAWIDPKEGTAKGWAGETGESDDPSSRSVRERAHYTELPFQYDAVVHYDGTLDDFVIGGTTYRWGKLRFNGGVTETKTLKLSADGYLWRQSDTPTDGLRFKAQVTREGPPTDTEPFGEYDLWIRSKSGRLTMGNDAPGFTPDETDLTTGRLAKRFDRFPATTGVRIAELELVRNQPLAEYALESRGEREEFVNHFRFMPRAFSER